MRENVFNCLPITYNLEINIHNPNKQISTVLHNFIQLFKVVDGNKEFVKEILASKEKIDDIILLHTKKSLVQNPKLSQLIGERLIPQCFDRK